MTDQLELRLNWKTLKVDNCPHTALRHDGIHLGEIPSVTCYHPYKPHCGGSFDGKNFNRNGVILHEGKTYSLDNLKDW